MISKWTFIDSIYFWFVTFTTVGFGDVIEPLESEVDYVIPLVLYRIFGLTLLAGVIDSMVAWLKVRKKALKMKAQSDNGKSFMRSAFLKWLDNVSVIDDRPNRLTRRSNLSLPTYRSVDDLSAIRNADFPERSHEI